MDEDKQVTREYTGEAKDRRILWAILALAVIFLVGIGIWQWNRRSDTTTYTGCVDTWRYVENSDRMVPRYALLMKQFEYYSYDWVCSAYFNDPLYEPHD